jgi:hypothetical protein
MDIAEHQLLLINREDFIGEVLDDYGISNINFIGYYCFLKEGGGISNKNLKKKTQMIYFVIFSSFLNKFFLT